MYFPAILVPKATTVRSVYRFTNRDTTIVYRDEFTDKGITALIATMIRRRPANGVLQELLITPPEGHKL